MNKNMPKNVKKNLKKTTAVCAMSSIMALGAFAFLKSNVVGTQSNVISATNEEGNLDNKLAMTLTEEENPIAKYNALPQTEAEALKETPYSFKITNTGTFKQMVRLTASEIKATTNAGTELPADKIHVVVKESKDGSGAEIYKGTISEMKTQTTGTDKGFGKCIEFAPNAAKEFAVYAWVDENATAEDLYGAGTEKKSIEFKMGGLGIQKDGMFSTDDLSTEQKTSERFEAILGGH